MNKLSGPTYWAIKHKFLVFLIMAAIFIGGMSNYMTLPKQEYPVVQMPFAVITAVYPGASASDMEELVTKKLEEAAMEAAGYSSCSSKSMSSVSVVTVNFENKLDKDTLDKNIDDLRNKINSLRDALPSGVTSLNFNTDALDSADMVVAITGEGRSNEELTERAQALKDKLTGLDGVSKVVVEGEREKKVEVTVNTDKLSNTSLSLSNIASLIGAQNSMLPIGTINMPDSRLTVTSSGKFQSIDEIRDIVVQVSPTSGAVVKLKDIADVAMSSDLDAKHYYYNGKEAVLVDLYFKDKINMLDAGKGVSDAVDTYQASLPSGMALQTISYLPGDVSESVNNFTGSLIESILIVVGVIMLGMSLRNGLIISIAIPLSIMATFLVMKFFNIDIQFISLAALIIALGMLVDNAVVVSDEIQVRLDRGEEKLEACINGVKTVALPVLASTGTTIAIFFMFLMLPGIMGEFSFSLPVICCSALIFSYMVSMLVTPMLCYLWMKKTPESKLRKAESSSKGMTMLSDLLNLSFKHKGMTLAITGAALVLSVFLLSNLTSQMLPVSTKTVLDISLTTEDTNDVRKTEQQVKLLEQVLAEQPETEYYLTSVAGRIPKYDFSSQPSTDAKNVGSAFLRFNLKKGGRYNDKMTYLQDFQKELNARLPGCRVIVRELGVMPSGGNDIQLFLSGDDFVKLNAAADIAVSKLKEMGSTRNVYASKMLKNYDYYVETKNDLLNTYGLTKGEVQNELSIALMGRDATIYRTENKEYPVTVKSDIASQQQLERFGIRSSRGNSYQLGQLSNVGIKGDYASIDHHEGKRVVSVTADVNKGSSPITLQGQLTDYMTAQNLTGVEVIGEGQRKSYMEAMGSFGSGAAIGILLVFLIIYIEFNSLRNTLVIMCTVPMTIIGSSIGLTIFNQELSFFAIMGIISLIGVVVNNAIVLVDYTNKARASGMAIDDACKTSVLRRVRPIVLSAITAVLGMLPLATSDKNILFRGLSISFMCGLFVCMLSTLVVIPVIYSLLEDRDEQKGKKQFNENPKEAATL